MSTGAAAGVVDLPVRALRHRWGEPVRYRYKTERCCTRCDVVKVTRHESGVHPWIEFWRDGARLDLRATPPCGGGA